MEDLPVEVLKVLIYSQVNAFGGGLLFTKYASLEFIPAISLKREFLNYRKIFCEITLQNHF